MRLALLALCSCNTLFDLRKADLDEYVPPDGPPPDAAFTCPPIGTAPTFDPQLNQLVLQSQCRDLSISTASDMILGDCDSVIAEGRIGDELVPALGFVSPYPNHNIFAPRLSAEGNEALVVLEDRMTLARRFALYVRGPDRVWTFAGDQDLPAPGSFVRYSGPTRGPQRRVVVSEAQHHEYVLTGNSWQLTQTYNFPVNTNTGLRMSPDGLRLTSYGFVAGRAFATAIYADRASVNDRFSEPVELPGGAPVASLMLAEDCSRLYFWELDSLFYQQRSN